MFVHAVTWALLKNKTVRDGVVPLVSELERSDGYGAPSEVRVTKVLDTLKHNKTIGTNLSTTSSFPEIMINQNPGEGAKNEVNLMCKADGPEWYKGWSIADNVGALSGCPGFPFIGSVHPFFSIC